MCFLDDEDLRPVERWRGPHMKPGSALQLVTVRLGVTLADPVDVPSAVLDCVADRLGIADP